MIIKDFHKAAIITPDSEVSYLQLMQYIETYANILNGAMVHNANQNLGAKKDKRKVLVFSENCEEWIYAFFAIWRNGDIAVTVDATSTVSDVAYIMNDCRPDAIWFSPTTEQTAREAMAEAGVTMQMLSLKGIAIPENVIVPSQMEFKDDINATNKVALIIYTSGTTGSPKGVMLSYENLEANIAGVADEVPIFNGERRTLMLLPVHHVLPLVGTVIAPITRGGGLAICPTLSGPDIMNMLCRGKIAILVGVPRLWQTLYTAMKKKIDSHAITRALFRLCERANSRTLSRIIFSSVHKKMGGHLDYCVSGGAALDTEIGNGLRTLGLDVLEGYGMTETAPIIAFTRPGDYIPGCSGKPLPSVEVKIENGELLARGRNLMLGYYNRPEETAEVIDKDGFIHTGDLARIDEEGRVYITGRSKEIIVLSNGKNVQPNEIEFKLEKYDAYVKEAAVTEKDDQLCAIIVPQTSAANANLSDAEWESIIKREVIQPYNTTVENYKKIMNIFIYHNDLPRTKLDKLKRFKLKEIITPAAEAPKSASVAADTKKQGNKVLDTILAYIANEKKLNAKAEDHIETDLAFDSLDKVTLQSYIEETFGVLINADDMASFKTIGEMCAKIEKEAATSNGDSSAALEKFDWHEILNAKSTSAHALPTSGATHSLFSRLFKIYLRFNNRLTIRGLENIPAEGPVIIAPNHQCYFDGPLAVSGMSWTGVRDYYFYATEEHVNTPIRRWLASRHNIIIMERRNLKNSILKMSEVLKGGKRLVIFPEGSRTHDGELMSFKKTFAILSRELNVPIVPVCIKGAFEAMPRGRVLPTPHHITVEYLPSIHPDSITLPTGTTEKSAQDAAYTLLAEKVKAAIAEKLK